MRRRFIALLGVLALTVAACGGGDDDNSASNRDSATTDEESDSPRRTTSTEDDNGDFTIDEKQKQAHLTDAGHQHIEELLIKEKLLDPGESLYHASNIMLMHHVNAALKAHSMFHRDVDYIVKDNQVVIVDEHTGRTMPGRRWSEGLHQAVEAKEGASIQNENQTPNHVSHRSPIVVPQRLREHAHPACIDARGVRAFPGWLP